MFIECVSPALGCTCFQCTEESSALEVRNQHFTYLYKREKLHQIKSVLRNLPSISGSLCQQSFNIVSKRLINFDQRL